MIFTIGNEESYEQYFLEDECPKKLGRTPDYSGGIAFQTKTEADEYATHASSNFSYKAYGLDCDWNNTYWSQELKIYCIIESTRLVKI